AVPLHLADAREARSPSRRSRLVRNLTNAFPGSASPDPHPRPGASRREPAMTQIDTLPTLDPTMEALEGKRYLSVNEASQVIGISALCVYGYIASGKLPAYRLGRQLVVDAEQARRYQRQASARPRERVPAWHVPPRLNPQYLTCITVRLREGQ